MSVLDLNKTKLVVFGNEQTTGLEELPENVVVVTRVLMMTSSNGKIVRITGHLCGELTGPR